MTGSGRVRRLALPVVLLAALAGCSVDAPGGDESSGPVSTTTSGAGSATQDDAGTAVPDEGGETTVGASTLRLSVGDEVLTATLADNSSVDALKELLADGPITIDMRDYGDMEKVGPLGADLPRNDERITTSPGDLILYQGNALVIYYAPNSWSFTRLGRIEGVTPAELKAALGTGDVKVTLTLDS